jgi:hypothetical protein
MKFTNEKCKEDCLGRSYSPQGDVSKKLLKGIREVSDGLVVCHIGHCSFLSLIGEIRYDFHISCV